MAFRASITSLQDGFQRVLQLANTEKTYLNNWKNQLAGNITGLDAVAMLNNLDRALAEFAAVAALPGLSQYAKDQFGDQAYDVSAEFTGMVNALTAIKSWLKTNIPSNAVSITNGVLVGVSYTPAQTSQLLSLVNAAIATIN